MKQDDTLDHIAALSSEIRRLTLTRLEEIPTGFINWRLNNTAMSFAHLVQHIINVDEMFFNLTTTNKKTFTWLLGTEEPHVDIDKAIYKSMLKKLKNYGAKRDKIIRSFNTASVNELVHNNKDEKMTIWWFLMHKVLEHETYHRGQIAAYLKVLKGESS
ncbi:DinB family protein [Winogradskyella sp.]|uniref:DinB family protein n=1 Tax=uncultured Winogradskyella sp. TaxID=395353 RepID=UPI00236F7C04|nr:DinB family protein [Winogradskyella sp.]MDC0006769.1 DinB family protein [Winogradskyella sp.]|tara:strand:+ start:19100 stop:19576 length:477 start_codon:yes stop_codon:yes gene_type:complete